MSGLFFDSITYARAVIDCLLRRNRTYNEVRFRLQAFVNIRQSHANQLVAGRDRIIVLLAECMNAVAAAENSLQANQQALNEFLEGPDPEEIALLLPIYHTAQLNAMNALLQLPFWDISSIAHYLEALATLNYVSYLGQVYFHPHGIFTLHFCELCCEQFIAMGINASIVQV